jgi:hypothetical protein
MSSRNGLLELPLSETLTNTVCVLPREMGSCSTRTETDNNFRLEPDECDIVVVVDDDFTFDNTCTTWLLINEY